MLSTTQSGYRGAGLFGGYREGGRCARSTCRGELGLGIGLEMRFDIISPQFLT